MLIWEKSIKNFILPYSKTIKNSQINKLLLHNFFIQSNLLIIFKEKTDNWSCWKFLQIINMNIKQIPKQIQWIKNNKNKIYFDNAAIILKKKYVIDKISYY